MTTRLRWHQRALRFTNGLLIACIAGAAVGSTACVVHATDAPFWSKAGAPASVFSVERKACVDQVELELYEESYVDPIFPMSMAERRLEARFWARDAYIRCMHAQGWVLAGGARISAPPEIYYP